MNENLDQTQTPQILLICGDYWHAPAGADYALTGLCKEMGLALTSAFCPHDVPWEALSDYTAIVLYKEGRASAHDERARWLTPDQEQQLADFAYQGGGFLGLHSGVCSYSEGGPMRDMMRGHFLRHPPQLSYTVLPDGEHRLCRGVEPFTLFDELYVTDVSADATEVFLESEAAEHGRLISGWMHHYGDGTFVGLTPGHTAQVMTHPMMTAVLRNILTELVA